MAPPRTYIYKAKAQQALKPGQMVKFRNGRYYLAARTPTKPRPTQAQLDLTQAKALAQASLGPSIAQVERAVKEAEAARIANIEKSRGLTEAFGKITEADAVRSGASYADAASRIGQYGAAFAGEQTEAQIAGALAANEQIARISGGPGVPVPTAQDASATFYTGAVLPGAELAAAGIAATTQATAAREASLAAQNEAQRLTNYQSGIDVGKIRAQVSELEAKRPAVTLEALTNLRELRNQERATEVQVATLKLQTAKTAWERAEAMTDLTQELWIVKNGNIVNTHKPAPGSEAARAAATVAARDRATEATATAARNRDLTTQARDLTNATGFLHKVVNGKVVNTKVKAPGSKAEQTRKANAKKGKTNREAAVKNMNQDLQDAQKEGANYALQLRGDPVQNPKPAQYVRGRSGAYMLAPGKTSELGPGATTTNNVKLARYNSAFDYEGAYRQVWNYISGDQLMARYALPQKRIDTLVKKILAGALWTPPPVAPVPGERGGPSQAGTTR